jgi:type II secretory pathway component PulF
MKEALKVMASTIDEALGQELASQMEQAVEEGVESMRAGMARTNMPESVLVMRRKIEKSAGDMASLLQSVDSKWKEHTGLCKVRCRREAWVHEVSTAVYDV